MSSVVKHCVFTTLDIHDVLADVLHGSRSVSGGASPQVPQDFNSNVNAITCVS